MADTPAAERTEQATPERLRQAREEGQIPQSQEVPSIIVLVAVVAVLAITAGTLCRYFIEQFQQGLTFRLRGPLDLQSMSSLLSTRGSQCLIQLVPVLAAACMASIVGSVIISGWSVSFKAVSLKMENISPMKGFRNLISLKSVVNMLTSLAKITVIGVIAALYLRDRMDRILAVQWSGPMELLSTMGGLILGVCGRMLVGLASIAAIDLFYQRWQHRRNLRMTRQEVKEERKRYEMPAEVKGHMRSVQLTLARKRMLQKVKTADVIVTNPTHVAVALRYDAASMSAPVVVAKGADLMATRIRQIAQEHQVPIVERPELARALYATVDLDQPVPESLFVAVAEIMAVIYRMRKQRRGKR